MEPGEIIDLIVISATFECTITLSEEPLLVKVVTGR